MLFLIVEDFSSHRCFFILLVKDVILLDYAISWMSRVLTNWRVKFLVVLSFIFVSHFLLGNQEQLVEKIFTLESFLFSYEKDVVYIFLPSFQKTSSFSLQLLQTLKRRHHSVRKFACKIKINRWEHLVMSL